MKKIVLQNREVEVRDSWQDLTTEEYIKLMLLYDESENLMPEIFMIKFIEILTGENENFIMSLYEDELLEFPQIIANFKLEEFIDIEKKSFILDGKLYSYNLPEQLTLGEKISIKLLEKNSTTQYEQWLNILAILIRPATEKTNEFGEIVYELEPFDGNIDVLTKRKELLKKLPGIHSVNIIKAFTNGRLKY